MTVSEAMEEIYNYLDGKDDCQYSQDKLMEQISGVNQCQQQSQKK